MKKELPALTHENEKLSRELEQLKLEFLELFTRHKEMVENDSVFLTSLYLEKLGHLQLELLEKQTETSQLKMKMNLIQASINCDKKPDLIAIEQELNNRLKNYYAQIASQSAALDEAKKVLSNLLTEEETQKLKELFRVLCKKLHPDLNPGQTEAEKDLFIKVKAAYDLQQISELQKILLFLNSEGNEDLTLISGNEKKQRIENLKKNITALKNKIDLLRQNFPFNIEKQIFDEFYLKQKQDELRDQIKKTVEEAAKFLEIIKIMTDE